MWSCLRLQSHPVPTVSPSLWCSYTSRLLIHLVAKLTPSLTLLPSSSLCLYCPSLESQLRGLEHSSPQDFLWPSSLNLPLCHVPLFLSFFLFFFWPPPKGFPGGASGKEPACQCKRRERHGFHPWVEKIPWRRAWQPTPVLLPGESHGQRSLVVYSPQGCKESDMTEAT